MVCLSHSFEIQGFCEGQKRRHAYEQCIGGIILAQSTEWRHASMMMESVVSRAFLSHRLEEAWQGSMEAELEFLVP